MGHSAASGRREAKLKLSADLDLSHKEGALIEPPPPKQAGDITELALTYLDGGLVIEFWHPRREHVRRVRD